MPTAQMDLPEPKTWQEFDTIVRDAQAQRWKSTTLQMNGRHGQKQHGVNIFGPDDIDLWAYILLVYGEFG